MLHPRTRPKQQPIDRARLSCLQRIGHSKINNRVEFAGAHSGLYSVSGILTLMTNDVLVHPFNELRVKIQAFPILPIFS